MVNYQQDGSDAEGGIKENDFLVVFKTEVLGGQLDGIGGLIGVHIQFQTLGSGVISGLDLNGDKLPLTLDNKVYFGTALRLLIVGAVVVDGQLYIDIILCHTALEIVQLLDHVQNVIGG